MQGGKVKSLTGNNEIPVRVCACRERERERMIKAIKERHLIIKICKRDSRLSL